MSKTEEELWYHAGQVIGLCMKNGLTTDEARKSISLAKDIMEGKVPSIINEDVYMNKTQNRQSRTSI